MREYSNNEIRIIWDPKKCIHARECVKGLPEVFRRDCTPWINMQGAGLEEIMKVVDRCPSGALTYEKAGSKDRQGASEPWAGIRVMKNGPLLVEGGCPLMDEDGKELSIRGPYALCRCGSSGKKPFCDGTHIKINSS